MIYQDEGMVLWAEKRAGWLGNCSDTNFDVLSNSMNPSVRQFAQCIAALEGSNSCAGRKMNGTDQLNGSEPATTTVTRS
jgi:hypothetical protein